MKLIKREYLNTLIDVMGTPDIKIITGVRRSGKSKLLELFKEYIYNWFQCLSIKQWFSHIVHWKNIWNWSLPIFF